MEQLELQVESQLFEQDEKGLAEMTELIGIDNDLASKIKMQRIKILGKPSTAKWRAMKRKHECASKSYLLL